MTPRPDTRKRLSGTIRVTLTLAALMLLAPAVATAFPFNDGSPLDNKGGGLPINFLWTLVATVMVFSMQAGFALVEAGFTRAKNTVAILMKNLVDFATGSLIFFLVGFGLMFGTSNSPTAGFFGTDAFMLMGGPFPFTDDTAYADVPWSYTFLLWQMVFAATAATIVSGAMAERTRFSAYLLYCVFITGLIYPVFGHWVWGSAFQGSGGWLQAPVGGLLHKLELPKFHDFAGSTVVHSIGGWAALAGAIMVGPRTGKFTNGRINPIPGHSMPLSFLGMFILWLGWFGFNAGSTLTVTGGHEVMGGTGKAIGLIALNTNLSACAGALTAVILTMMRFGKADLGLSINGALGGLVGITAGCANVYPASAIAIGAIAGCIVVFAVLFIDSIGIDDPVGAISVHLCCGIWGTLACALFDATGKVHLGVQLLGVVAAALWVFPTMLLFFFILKNTIGLRVDPEDEEIGLDITEHGAVAYVFDDLDRDV